MDPKLKAAAAAAAKKGKMDGLDVTPEELSDIEKAIALQISRIYSSY
jgi:hypothetical protein